MIALQVAGLLFLQIIISTSAIPAVIKNDNGSVRKAFSLEDVTSDALISDNFNGTWLSDTEIFYRNEDQLLKLDVTRRKLEIIAKNALFNESGLDYYPSPDGNYVLIRNVTEKVYRHSSLSIYSIHNVKSNSTELLANGQRLSTAFWSPKHSSLVYVLKNDIYYHQLNGTLATTRRITFNGRQQAIYNGVPDWVYEEEVYGTDRAMWFSPTAKYLVFATFNDTQVPEAVILKYGKPGSLEDQYPKEERFRYPKAGAVNPEALLNVVDLTNDRSPILPLKAPIDIVGTEPILYIAGWLDSKTVVATWTNRVQNISQIVSYTLRGQPQYLLTQRSPGGWLLNPEQTPISYNGYVLLIKPQPIENATLGLFAHVTRYRFVNSVLTDETDLTPGGYWVHQIKGVNKAKGVITFTASPPGEPSQKQIYEVGLEGHGDSVFLPTCLSCGHKSPEGNECKYVSTLDFSPNLSNYVMTCAGPDPATIAVYAAEDNRALYNWSINHKLRQVISKRLVPRQIDLYVESHGFNSKVRLMLPEDFDENKKYPMLLTVYAGPNSQRINDNFALGFETYMTSNKQVIHATIDGRGSSSRGTAMMYAVYRDLGNAEIDDQITVTKKLQHKFSWIDSNRTGIWGWSYGGYATARALSKDDDNVFKCGISVAPVTNWIYYDSIYTERYMALPTINDNSAGYESSSVMNRVEQFRGKKFMLIHGTGDDNVHFQQSMALNKALAEADILYDQLSYPDEDHSLARVSKHLYHTMDRFWDQCFGFN